jgi:fibronectin type III domain protein
MTSTSLSFPDRKTCHNVIAGLILLLCTPLLSGCGGGGNTESGPIVSNTPSQGGGGSSGSGGSSGASSPPVTAAASASLAWDPVSDPSIVGYIVHYGTHSPNSSGSCAYAQSTFSSSPAVTVSGLAPNTTYFFAVSAYNGLESACSAEVSTVTASI